LVQMGRKKQHRKVEDDLFYFHCTEIMKKDRRREAREKEKNSETTRRRILQNLGNPQNTRRDTLLNQKKQNSEAKKQKPKASGEEQTSHAVMVEGITNPAQGVLLRKDREKRPAGQGEGHKEKQL